MRIRNRATIPSSIPQVSLADMAFLLLIFFISTTTLNLEMGIPLVLPGQSSQPVLVDRPDLLVLHSDAEGHLFVDGRPAAGPEIRGLVEQRLVENPKTVVSIETHPEAPYQAMVLMLDQVKLARAERISLRLHRP